MINKYPDNPYCTRPKDSGMRKWCQCVRCRKYAHEQGEPDPLFTRVKKEKK
jgi:hypothetical protein